MPRSFVATTLHSDLKYGDLKMVCKCGDNLNIPDFHRNLDMKPFYGALYYIKVSNMYKVLIQNSMREILHCGPDTSGFVLLLFGII